MCHTISILPSCVRFYHVNCFLARHKRIIIVSSDRSGYQRGGNENELPPPPVSITLLYFVRRLPFALIPRGAGWHTNHLQKMLTHSCVVWHHPISTRITFNFLPVHTNLRKLAIVFVTFQYYHHNFFISIFYFSFHYLPIFSICYHPTNSIMKFCNTRFYLFYLFIHILLFRLW